MKLRNPNNSIINKNKLIMFLARMRDRLRFKEGGSVDDAIRTLHKLFEIFFTTLGKPTLKIRRLFQGDDPDPAPYNLMMEEIEHDIQTAYEETAASGNLVIETFNIGLIAAEELNQRATEAASKIVDIKLLAGQLDQDVIIAGDDFQNTDRIDTSFPLQNPAAEIRPKEGIVTLARLESVNLVDVNTRVTIEPQLPLNISTLPTSDNTNRFYEGNFYDYIGSARPEGGSFHLEERITPTTEDSIDGDSEIFDTDLSVDDAVFEDIIDERLASGERQNGLPLRPEDILVIDRGANEQEKDVIRTNMIDGNPDTFWEAEYVINAESIHEFVDELVDDEIRNVTPTQLRAKAVEIDSIQNIDLEVQITLELSETAPVNWLSLNPMNFGETAWLEITEVSTSEDAQAGFLPIEGFDQNRFANVLTNEANEELQVGTVSDVLAPSKFAFRGTAVYTFPVRTAKFIRIRIKQRVPVPDPYQRMALQLNRVITNTQTYMREPDKK